MSSQVIRKRGKTSHLWSYFSIQDAENKFAECDICGKKFSYKSTVTNLKKHIERKHSTIKIKLDGYGGAAKNTAEGTEITVTVMPPSKLREELEKNDRSSIHVIDVNQNAGSESWVEAEPEQTEEVYTEDCQNKTWTNGSALETSATYFEENEAESTTVYETTSTRTSEFEKMISYLQERYEFTKRDDLDLFFESACKSTKKLPRKLQNKIKMSILSTISKYEDEFEDAQTDKN